MKRVHLLLLTLLLLGVWTLVSAQEIPEIIKGKFPVASATCPVDKHYVMGKDKPNKLPCILFTDGVDENTAWVLIFDKHDKKTLAVLEITATGQKVVWRAGRKTKS